MIYLDANAFYWYLGREKLPMKNSIPKLDVEKLRDFLDFRDDKSIPSSVFMEMLVHFREHPEALKMIIEFREEKKIKVLNNTQGYCFTPDELTILHINKDSSFLKHYAYNLLEKKVDIEVKHTYVFLQVVSLLYAEYYLKTCSSLSSETKRKTIYYLGKDISDELHEKYISQLSLELKRGYDNDKAQQNLKNKYIELLVENCIIFHMIIDTMVKYMDDEKDLYNVMCKSAADARNNGFTDNGIMKIIVDSLAMDSDFLKSAENEISDMFKRKGYSEHQAQYLKMMLQAWLERGKKLVKNDIFDMLCVGVLDKIEYNPKLSILVNQCPYLISFDETMMKFICRDSGNANLIKQFML